MVAFLRTLCLFLTALGTLGACHVERVQSVPFTGPAPRAVVVAPLVDPEGLAPATLLTGADTALRGRGMRVLPLATGIDLLRSQGALLPDGSLDLRAVVERLDVDSVLLVGEPSGRDRAGAEGNGSVVHEYALAPRRTR